MEASELSCEDVDALLDSGCVLRRGFSLEINEGLLRLDSAAVWFAVNDDSLKITKIIHSIKIDNDWQRNYLSDDGEWVLCMGPGLEDGSSLTGAGMVIILAVATAVAVPELLDRVAEAEPSSDSPPIEETVDPSKAESLLFSRWDSFW